MWLAKTNAGKFSHEITNNGEKCGWLKQMRAADEKHDSNKQWPNYTEQQTLLCDNCCVIV